MKENTRTWVKKAQRLHQSGDMTAAEPLYRKALAQTPNDIEALFLLGTLYMQRGEIEIARPLLERVLSLNPKHAQALNNLGLGLSHAGQYTEALAFIERAIDIKPTYSDAWHCLGGALRKLNRLEEAEAAYRRLTALDPHRFDGFDALGRILQEREQWEAAESCFLRALECAPQSADTLNELGTIYIKMGRLRESMAVLRRALIINPHHPAAHSNLGACLQDFGDLPEALKYYQIAHALNPNDPLPPWNISFVELMQGRIREGWAAYALRWGALTDVKHPPFAAWQGEDLTGCSILIYPEQGLGDEILFASCLPDIIGRAARVGVICERRLGPIYVRSFPSVEIFATREQHEGGGWTCWTRDCDYQSAIGSLPRFLRTTLEDFPDHPAYLYADPEKVTAWRTRLDALGSMPKVGICWRSGLTTGIRHRYYTPITAWEPILTLPNITFINLQYGECAEELAEITACFGVNVVNFSDLDLRNDQEGVAALMVALDIVVSAGTAVAELAGALGVPVFRYSDRSWTSLGTNRMPWHPTMQLFTRNDPEDSWDATTAEIAAALQKYLAIPHPRLIAHSPTITDPSAVITQALAAHARGDLTGAERRCRQVLAAYPDHADSWHLLACVLREGGAYQEALSAFDNAHTAQPQEPTILLNRGLTRQDLGHNDAALQDFHAAIALDTTCCEARLSLGELLNTQGVHDAAFAALEPALDHTTDDSLLAQIHHAIAHALIYINPLERAQQHFVLSETYFQRAVEAAPQSVDLLSRLGALYLTVGRLRDAVTVFRRVLDINANTFEAHNGLASALQELGALPEALQHHQIAHALRPNHPTPLQQMTFTQLMQGQLVAGWASYEQRWEISGGGRDTRCPMWQGEDLTGRSILATPEQGLGDEILFASCLPDLLARAARVGIVCERRLGAIYARSFPHAEIYPTREPNTAHWVCAVHAYDYQVAGGSLPGLLRTRLEDFPNCTAYLQADPIKVAAWRMRLADLGTMPKVGICWRSGLRGGVRYRYYTPIAAWQPILTLPHLTFINLQYGECAEELAEITARFGVNVVNFSDLDLRNDQDNLAALMIALDSVVSAPTAVAELAAALGVPVLRYSDKAWTSLGTDKMPWHPTMQLFTRADPEEPWDATTAAIATALQERFSTAHVRTIPNMTTDRGQKIKNPSAEIARALTAREQGALAEAEQRCRRVLAWHPRHADSWHLLGCVLREQGAYQEAISALDKAHAIQPKEATILLNRGLTHQDLGQNDTALRDFRAAVALDRHCLEARLSLGESLDAHGDYAEALSVLEPTLKAATHDPRFAAQVHYAIAHVSHAQKQYDKAEHHFREAVRLDPDYSGAHNGLGNLLRDQSRLEEALACYQTAVVLRPDTPEFHNNTGNALRELGYLSKAEAAYREALRLKPDYADAWSNLGNVLNDRGLCDEAITAYRRALSLNPDDVAYPLNLSYALLRVGQLVEGWAAYAARWSSGTQGQMVQWYPDWHGEDLTGRKILLLPEQGLGDEIMFASCLLDVLTRAALVVLVCQKRLAHLYARAFPAAQIVAMPEGLVELPRDLPVCDYQSTLGSLPRVLRTHLEDFPPRAAYLYADPTHVDQWRTRLAAYGANLKVGICWRSGLRSHGRNRYYTPIESWGPIFAVPGVTFINLQYDECTEELATVRSRFGIDVITFSDLDLRNDQDGVAALMTALDGVISAPTAVAELAGALGVPVLRYDANWTSLGTDYMPWHPTMQVFTVVPEAPWIDVTTAMASVLSAWSIEHQSALQAAASTLQFVETPHGSLLTAQVTAQDVSQNGVGAPNAQAIALLTSLVRPGNWVIEVGAGLGALTLPLAHAVGAEGLVVACEADAPLFHLLCANIAINALQQVHAECMSVDAAVLPTADVDSITVWRQSRQPRAASIDTLALPQCDVIRIDAHRVDVVAVLAGAQATVTCYRPFIHITDEGISADCRSACAAQLIQMGYAWQSFGEANTGAGWLAYPSVSSPHTP